MSACGSNHHIQGNDKALRNVISLFYILRSVSVNQSGGFNMEIGVLSLSHVLLVLAELIVCSCKEGVYMHPTTIHKIFLQQTTQTNQTFQE